MTLNLPCDDCGRFPGLCVLSTGPGARARLCARCYERRRTTIHGQRDRLLRPTGQRQGQYGRTNEGRGDGR